MSKTSSNSLALAALRPACPRLSWPEFGAWVRLRTPGSRPGCANASSSRWLPWLGPSTAAVRRVPEPRARQTGSRRQPGRSVCVATRCQAAHMLLSGRCRIAIPDGRRPLCRAHAPPWMGCGLLRRGAGRHWACGRTPPASALARPERDAAGLAGPGLRFAARQRATRVPRVACGDRACRILALGGVGGDCLCDAAGWFRCGLDVGSGLGCLVRPGRHGVGSIREASDGGPRVHLPRRARRDRGLTG